MKTEKLNAIQKYLLATWEVNRIIKEFAASHFDLLFKFTEIKLKPSDMDFYESSKLEFVSIVEKHLENRALEITPKEISQVIKDYGNLGKFFLSILLSNRKKTKNNIKKLFIRYKELEKKLTEELDKRRTFPLKLMKKIKEIERNNKKAIPKLTQVECVVFANRELQIFDESDLIDESKTPKQLAISIRDSYKAQKKSL